MNATRARKHLRPWKVLDALAVTGSASILAWAAIGKLAEQGGTDRLIAPPPAADSPAPVTVGLAAIVFAGTSILLLIGDRGRSRDPKLARRLVSVALAAAAGVLVGLVGRLATALSDGANIGGVAAILLGLPSALALLMGALLIGRAGGEGAENAPAG